MLWLLPCSLTRCRKGLVLFYCFYWALPLVQGKTDPQTATVAEVKPGNHILSRVARSMAGQMPFYDCDVHGCKLEPREPLGEVRIQSVFPLQWGELSMAVAFLLEPLYASCEGEWVAEVFLQVVLLYF